MPIDGVMVSSCPSTSTGVCPICSSLAATLAAPAAWVSGMRMMNSSPPSREMVSCSRTTARRRAASCTSTASPTRWPSESLIFLKWSRSRNISATEVCARAARCRAVAQRSASSRRLGRPVRASKCASWVMRLSACNCSAALASSAFTVLLSSTVRASTSCSSSVRTCNSAASAAFLALMSCAIQIEPWSGLAVSTSLACTSQQMAVPSLRDSIISLSNASPAAKGAAKLRPAASQSSSDKYQRRDEPPKSSPGS